MAERLRDLQLIELKDTISDLNKVILSQQELIDAKEQREKELEEELSVLKEQIDYLTKKLFGTSSEKRSHDIPGQLELFNEAEAEADPSLLVQEEEEKIESYTRKRKKKTSFTAKFAHLPVRKINLDIPENGKVCRDCGTPMELIGTEFVRREFHYIPARGEVIEYYSLNYKCPSCTDNYEIPVIVKGKDGHPHMLHGMASSATIAWVMHQKYEKHIPLYRQESIFKEQLGVDLGRATLANWIISNSLEFFTPLYNYFQRQLLKRTHLMADETPVQVLKEEGRRPQAKSYMWLFRTGEYNGPPIILYHYSPTRAGDTAVNFLDGFEGYLMCDGYSGYNKVPKAKRTSCWAHVRRYLLDAIPKGKENDYTEPAVQGLLYVDKLFAIERDIHAKYTDPDIIKEQRIRKESDILDGFFTWLDIQQPIKNSRMDKAVTYIRNRRPYLTNYLEDGRCSFSNNASEREIKPFVIGRKNWLFCDTPDGARASELIYSIIETAKANGVNSYHYLHYLLDICPTDKMSEEELESISPWNESVKREIDRRFTLSIHG